MIQYTWGLGSVVAECPACGHRRFKPLVHQITGELYPDSTYGWCNRINSCGYKKFLSNNIRIDSSQMKKKPIKRKPKVFYPKALYEQKAEKGLTDSLKWYLNLVSDYKNSFDEVVQFYDLKVVKREEGRQCFPFIDSNNQIHAIQTKAFRDGHTIKDSTNWLHFNSDYYRQDRKIDTIFGGHLNLDELVILVEAPKTAILCFHLLINHQKFSDLNCELMDYYNCNDVSYVAVGGLSYFKEFRLRGLKKSKKVVAIPDVSEKAYSDWTQESLKFDNMEVFDFPNKESKEFEGWDLADFITKYRMIPSKLFSPNSNERITRI